MTTNDPLHGRQHDDFEAAYHIAAMEARDCYWKEPGEGREDADPDPQRMR